RQPVLRANNDAPIPAPAPTSTSPSSTVTPATQDPASVNISTAGTLPGSQSQPPSSANANELHVQVEAPFVFHATGPPPAPVEDARALPLDSRSMAQPALVSPLPPRSGPRNSA